MEYTREQKQALRNIDISLVYERFGLNNIDDKRIKNAVDVLVFVKQVPFSEAVSMLAEEFPEILEGPLLELPESKQKQETKTDAPAKENLTLRAQKAFFTGVRCSLYDIMLLPQIEDRKKIQIFEQTSEKILDHKFQYNLKQANRAGDAVYIRPARQIRHGYLFIDDIDGVTIEEMKEDGHVFAAVIETSPKNFQGWLDAGIPLNERERQVMQRCLANQYGGDMGSTSGEHFGRLPGFLNTKNEHFDEGKAAGQFPWVMIQSYSEEVDPAMGLILEEIQNATEEKGNNVKIEEFSSSPDAMLAYRDAQRRLREKYMINGCDNSAIDFSICRIMWDAGFTQEIIAGTLKVAILEDGRDKKHPGEDYVIRTVSRALADKMPPETQEEESPSMYLRATPRRNCLRSPVRGFFRRQGHRLL